ncbi:hypothetical protein GCM10008170_11290 [Methylopila capsulata]|uniref:Uncharacterized protein n=1 Tax=Methylopila capsulata TaxID=61654 RepID=A0A9W6ITW7_9HYPH|nr:hypothetical protein GCM10008170_11290 [Methylopila capsulata]
MDHEIMQDIDWLRRLARFLYQAATRQLSLRKTRRRELGPRDDRVGDALVARDGYVPEGSVPATQVSMAPTPWPATVVPPLRRRSAMDSTDKGPNGRPTRKP